MPIMRYATLLSSGSGDTRADAARNCSDRRRSPRKRTVRASTVGDLVLGAGNLYQAVIVQAQRGQLPPPDAAGIQADGIGAYHHSQGGPMPEHDGGLVYCAPG